MISDKSRDDSADMEVIPGELVHNEQAGKIVNTLALNPQVALRVADASMKVIAAQDPVRLKTISDSENRRLGILASSTIGGSSIIGGIVLAALGAEFLPILLCFSFGAACTGGMLAAATGISVTAEGFTKMLTAFVPLFSKKGKE